MIYSSIDMPPPPTGQVILRDSHGHHKYNTLKSNNNVT
nr:MAG TPA: hypothetical protein [Caudoviricetes sp.]